MKVSEENGELSKQFEPGKNLPSNIKIKNNKATDLYIELPKRKTEFCTALKPHKERKRVTNKLGNNIYITES